MNGHTLLPRYRERELDRLEVSPFSDGPWSQKVTCRRLSIIMTLDAVQCKDLAPRGHEPNTNGRHHGITFFFCFPA